MTDQKQIELKSLAIMRSNAEQNPNMFSSEAFAAINGQDLEDWCESPDFLLRCDDFFLGLEHLEAHGHSKEAEKGKRMHAITDIWRKGEIAGIVGENARHDEEANIMRGHLLGELLGIGFGNLADPAVLQQLFHGLNYSFCNHTNKIEQYLSNVSKRLPNKETIRIGFLIDWHIDPLTCFIIQNQRANTFFDDALSGLINMVFKESIKLDYIFLNFLWIEVVGQEVHSQFNGEIIVDKQGKPVNRNCSIGVSLREIAKGSKP